MFYKWLLWQSEISKTYIIIDRKNKKIITFSKYYFRYLKKI